MGVIMAGDNRFEIISKARKDLIESTNIEDSPKEMEVLNNFLFRCWQMGWLNKYDIKRTAENVTDGGWSNETEEEGLE